MHIQFYFFSSIVKPWKRQNTKNKCKGKKIANPQDRGEKLDWHRKFIDGHTIIIKTTKVTMIVVYICYIKKE